MAVSTTETPAKKLKKRASIADLATTPVFTPDDVAETTKKRKKKHADAVLNGAGAEETPVKARKKEKKAEKDRGDIVNAADDLELVVTRLDDALSKEEQKKKRKRSEAVVEDSAPVVDVAMAETPSGKQQRKRKGEAAAAAEIPQDSVSCILTYYPSAYLFTSAIQNKTPAKEKKTRKSTVGDETAVAVQKVLQESVCTVHNTMEGIILIFVRRARLRRRRRVRSTRSTRLQLRPYRRTKNPWRLRHPHLHHLW